MQAPTESCDMDLQVKNEPGGTVSLLREELARLTKLYLKQMAPEKDNLRDVRDNEKLIKSFLNDCVNPLEDSEAEDCTDEVERLPEKESRALLKNRPLVRHS